MDTLRDRGYLKQVVEELGHLLLKALAVVIDYLVGHHLSHVRLARRVAYLGFLHLFRTHGCLLECGGDDQWSNILAGADLIRRKEGKAAFAMTFRLLTTSEGKKMGKTEKGAVWLDPARHHDVDFLTLMQYDAALKRVVRYRIIERALSCLPLCRFAR